MRHPIPDDALDDRLFFVGTAGSGKTYNAMGRVERLLRRNHRVVIPDPLGVWWGLRLGSEGKLPSGYDVAIFGGPHGDLPLTEHAGALIGETVAGMKESCILDLSQLGTKASERRFMLAFLTALYKHTTGEPLHVVFDEADMWAPQRLLDKEGEAAKLLGMMETVVRRGRVKGFVPWLISQRPAVISKDVLSQADGIVAFKLTSSQDRDAIGDWVEGQADKAKWRELWASLPTMERGQGLVWVPGRGILDTVQFPVKETYDSSRTPKRGERAARAAELRPLDLGKLKERLAKVEAETKANDPKALRGKIAELERQMRDAAASASKKGNVPDPNAIAKAEQRGLQQAAPTINALRKALEAAMKFIIEINARDFFKAGGDSVDQAAMEKAIKGALQQITQLIDRELTRRNKEFDGLRKQGQNLITRMKGLLDQDVTVKVDVRHNDPFTITSAPPPARPAPTVRVAPPNGDGTSYSGPQSKVLQALAMWRSLRHEQPTREMVAAVAGYKPSTGNYGNLIGSLVAAGAVGKPAPGRLSLLLDGVGVMSREEGRDMLLSTLTNPQKKIVAALVDADPRSREEVAEATGYQPNTGNYGNLIGSLGTIEVIVKPQPGYIALSDWAQELLSGYADRIAA